MMTLSEKPSASKLPREVWSVGLCTAAVFAASSVITPSLDALVRTPFGLNNRTSSGFLMANVLATLFVSPIVGWYSDRIGRRLPLIAVGLVVSGLLLAALPYIPNYRALVGVRFVQGIFDTMALVLLMARSLDIVDESNRGKAMGVVTTSLPLGYIAGLLLAGALGGTSLPLLFGVTGATLIAAGFWTVSHLGEAERVRPASTPVRDMVLIAFKRPRLLLPLAFAFADRFAFGAFAILTPFALKDIFDAGSPREVSLVTILFMVGFVVFSPLGGSVIQRRGSHGPLVIGTAAFGVMLALLGFVNWYGFATLMTLAGVASAFMYVPSIVLVGECAGAGERGTAMAAFNIVGTVGMLAGLAVCGILSDRLGYAQAYLVAGGLEVLVSAGAAVFFMATRKR